MSDLFVYMLPQCLHVRLFNFLCRGSSRSQAHQAITGLNAVRMHVVLALYECANTVLCCSLFLIHVSSMRAAYLYLTLSECAVVLHVDTKLLHLALFAYMHVVSLTYWRVEHA